jgi:hypothetical protein
MIACPRCKTALPPALFQENGHVVCPRCRTALDAAIFPALFRREAPPVERPAAPPEGARCFFHDERPAAQVCDACGRFVCDLCGVEFDGRRLCPTCIQSGLSKRRFEHLDRNRLRYDRLACMLAAWPLLMWPVTLVTAPVAIGVACYGWRRSSSLVERARVGLVTAVVLASLEVVGWVWFFVAIAGHKS